MTEFENFLATLKEKNNLVEVVSGYLSLERKGGTYWACCPFHHEKTASFAVNESEQFYHCFGCGESGDVIKFVREMENVEFMDAVKILAERVNLPLPATGDDSRNIAEAKRQKDAILKIMNETAHFYLDNLNSGKADRHIEYILNRKIPSGIVRKFGLGASLDFNSLPKYLLSKGFESADMLASGAVSEVDGRLIDSLGNRLIFPIINHMNEVIAFGGRVLEKTDFGKYKNTKDTIVFNKRKNLYNVNLLKKLKREQNISNVIVVEGYMDTLSLYQAGFKNVVATMGTSLTQEQARLMRRYSDNILISYDGDGAGQKANLRGLDILKSEGLNVKVVPLTDGLDPDDVIKTYGAEGYQKCLDAAMPLIDFKLQSAEQGYDISKAEDKRKFVADAIGIIKTADSAVEQEDLLKQLRDKTGLTYESLKRDLKSAPAAPPQRREEETHRKDSASVVDKASRFVVASYLFKAPYTVETDIESIPFKNGVHSVIAGYVRAKLLLEERIQPSELFEFFEEDSPDFTELTYVLDFCDGDAISSPTSEKYFKDCIRLLKIDELDAMISELNQKIKAETRVEERKNLLVQVQQLITQKEKIKGGE